MPAFSPTSKKLLESCHPRLQEIFNEVIQRVDCKIICGHRGEEEQNQLYTEGKSKLKYPRSRHNSYPSEAVDVVPYPVDWDDLSRFYRFAGYVEAVAARKGIELRWGGDWDRDWNHKNNRFNDLPHFELIKHD
jgi:peptidoglycan L-alanyl-D-glutamate endopeptidase CwlK